MDSKARQSALWNIGFILACAAFGLFVPYINSASVELLRHYDIIHGTFYGNVFIPAVTEPWTSKLLGPAYFLILGFVPTVVVALGVLMGIVTSVIGTGLFATVLLTIVFPVLVGGIVYKTPNVDFRRVHIIKKWWKAAPLAGVIFGIEELYYRMLPEFTWLFWNNPNYHPNLLGPVLLHIITGTIVVGTLLAAVSPRSRRSGLFLLGGIVTATGLHFIWNTWLIESAAPFWTAFHTYGSQVMVGVIVVAAVWIAISTVRDIVTVLSA